MAAYLLNVRLALHSVNVPIAHGKNVAAGFQCNARVIVVCDNLPMLFCFGILELSADREATTTYVKHVLVDLAVSSKSQRY